MMGLSIAQMKLSRIAREAAERLQAECPWVVFTSGRRDLDEQAHAMAVNVSLNRQWIRETYLHADSLHQWVMTHPGADTAQALHEGLYQHLLSLPDSAVFKISYHLTGDAFDVRPMVHEGKSTLYGEKILDVMRSLPGLDKVLLKEGGLIRWHAQFIPSVEV
jgi:hypothetical protein